VGSDEIGDEAVLRRPEPLRGLVERLRLGYWQAKEEGALGILISLDI
jgi:hypothetical protein